jgi:hypothetical protein
MVAIYGNYTNATDSDWYPNNYLINNNAQYSVGWLYNCTQNLEGSEKSCSEAPTFATDYSIIYDSGSTFKDLQSGGFTISGTEVAEPFFYNFTNGTIGYIEPFPTIYVD